MKTDVPTIADNYLCTEDIITDAISMVRSAQSTTYRQVNYFLLARNWLLGKRIAEEEMSSNREENYGKEIIKVLSGKLTEEFGKGFVSLKVASASDIA